MNPINNNGLRLILKKRAKLSGSERKLAEKLGVSYAYMNDLIRGKRRPGRKILSALSLREERVYVPTRGRESK